MRFFPFPPLRSSHLSFSMSSSLSSRFTGIEPRSFSFSPLTECAAVEDVRMALALLPGFFFLSVVSMRVYSPRGPLYSFLPLKKGLTFLLLFFFGTAAGYAKQGRGSFPLCSLG